MAGTALSISTTPLFHSFMAVFKSPEYIIMAQLRLSSTHTCWAPPIWKSKVWNDLKFEKFWILPCCHKWKFDTWPHRRHQWKPENTLQSYLQATHTYCIWNIYRLCLDLDPIPNILHYVYDNTLKQKRDHSLWHCVIKHFKQKVLNHEHQIAKLSRVIKCTAYLPVFTKHLLFQKMSKLYHIGHIKTCQWSTISSIDCHL